jgi:hypothetical protein
MQQTKREENKVAMHSDLQSKSTAPPFGSHPSCGHKAMWRHAGRKYLGFVSTQQKIASPSAETQQHGASGLQQSAQGPRKCLFTELKPPFGSHPS